MIVFLLLVLAFVCLVSIVFPFLIYPLTLSMMPKIGIADEPAGSPTFTLMFCAFNEVGAIPGKIANIATLRARHPDLEVLAYDDASDDGTGALLSDRSDLLTVVRGAVRKGKAHGMKVLARRASGEILVFTDANVELDYASISNLVKYYRDQTVGGVVGSLRYFGENDSATAAVGSLYWRMEERIKDRESTTGNVMGADGSIFSIRRALYPAFPDTVLDDMTTSMAVIFAGKRLVKAKDVIARERIIASRNDEYRRKIRIATRAYHTHLHMRPQLRSMSPIDRYKYAAHKHIRWFGGVFLIVGAIAVGAAAWRIDPRLFVGVLGLALVGYVVGKRARAGPLAALFDVVTAYMATLLGVLRALRGETMATWNKSR